LALRGEGSGSTVCSQTSANAPEEAQVDERVDQGVAVGDGLTIAQMRALDAKGYGLAVDAFGGRALAIGVFVSRTLSIQGIAEPGTDAGGHHRGAATLGPAFVIDRAGSTVGCVFSLKRADVLAALVFNEGGSAVGVGE